MQRCQCSPQCDAIVKTLGRLYARGHAPASHSEERNEKARVELHRLYGAGLITRLYGDDNVSKRPEVREKISVFHKGKPKSDTHKANLAGPKDYPVRENLGTGMLGKKHSKQTKKLMSDKKIAARNDRYWPSWNKGRKGLQVSWNKGLTKDTDSRVAAGAAKIVGHPIHVWGRYPYGGAIMRSTWEVAYAKYLDLYKLEWKYEPKAFYVGKGPWNGITYRPDFYVVSQDLYVEVKGAWLNGSEAKVREFRKRYPEINLLVVTEAVFREILHVEPRAA